MTIYIHPADERYNFNNGYLNPYLWYDPSPYKDLAIADLTTLVNKTAYFNNKILVYNDKNLLESGSKNSESLFAPEQANGVNTLYSRGSSASLSAVPITGFSQSYYDLGFVMISSFNLNGDQTVGSDLPLFSVFTGSSAIWLGLNSSGSLCGTITDTAARKLQFNVGAGLPSGSGSQSGISQVRCVFFRKKKQSYTVQVGYDSNAMVTYENTHYTRGLGTITYRGITFDHKWISNLGESLLFLDEQRDEVFTDIRKYYLKKWRGVDV